MVLVVEDGTGIATANTYVSAAGAAQFHSDRGTIDQWAAYLDAGTALGSLIMATQMIDAAYDWRGRILSTDQALKLPRHDFIDLEGRTWTAAKQIARAADATAMLGLMLLQRGVGTAESNITSERFPDYAVTYEGSKSVGYPDVDYLLAGLYEGGGLGRSRLRNVELVRWS